MAQILPFRAYRYNPQRVKFGDVLTQPYDKITPQMQERYYAASPYNLIPVEKGKPLPEDAPGNDVYSRAAAKLDEWIAASILVGDESPCLYAYFQDYRIPGANQRAVRKGFIALGRLEDYSAGVVFRHEHTLSGPKADRLELLRRTRTQTGQLFLLYSDAARRLDALLDESAQNDPAMEMGDEYDVVHRLWPIADPKRIQRIVAEMADKQLIIADGHHRYETALAYRDECRARFGDSNRNAPWEFAMMTLVNTHAEGLTILPTHRVVSRLPDFNFEGFRKKIAPWFDWYSYPFEGAGDSAAVLTEFRKDLIQRGRQRRAIGAFAGNGAYYLFLLRRNVDLAEALPDLSAHQRELDVVLLHRLILEKGLGITAEAVRHEALTYEREIEQAVAAVAAGRAPVCFLLNPVGIETMCRIALAGEVMPQKSTDFYPKMLSGLTLYRMESAG